ncbi:MAG: hypothetical protein ACRDRO_11715 [Pseudonocardiaceae bacterium]
MTQLLLPTDFSTVTPSVMHAVEVLAPPPTPGPDPGGQGQDFGKAAPLGLVVLLLFFLAVALLVRSMNKHLRRVPESFDDDSGTPPREK